MSIILQLGTTPIQLKDDEFGNGFQVGYLHFKTDFADKPVTDELLYTVMAQTFVNVTCTDRCNAGYLTGFMTALLENPSQRLPFMYILPQSSSQQITEDRKREEPQL